MNTVPTEALERTHAILSASASKTWLSCTPSARLSEQFPDSRSEYAEEGSLAHEVAELKLRKAFIENINARTYGSRLKKLLAKLDEHPKWDRGMDKHTDVYLEYVQGLVHALTSPPYVAVERRLDYSVWAPEGFGTGDCIVIGGGTLFINDLKYGKGVPVDAVGNTQMRLYALGAYAAYGFLYPIQSVKMAIIQPRLDSITEDEMTLSDLLAWGESIKPIAERAFRGEGEFVPGDHCRFCRARHTCRARADAHLALEGFNAMKPPLISSAEVGEILARAQHLARWVTDLEEYALSTCLSGGDVPGWKAVEGRGSRQYRSFDEAFAVLKAAGVEEAMLYERKPLTVASVEKLLGKARYRELLEPFVETKPGKPTLATSDDKREAITRQSAADDFSAVTSD